MATLTDSWADTGPSFAVEMLLHVFPSFGIGGVPLRMVRVLNHLGSRFRHTIIALDNNFEATEQLLDNVNVTLVQRAAKRHGSVRGAFSAALALHRLRPDVLLTYNWGAMEWAIANRLWPFARHIHLEAGFGREEADTQFRRRVLCRRWVLRRCARILVPSRSLEDLARHVWKLPAELVTYAPNGVDVARFAAPARDTLPGFTRRPGELVVGTVAPLRPEKNVGRLLRAFALLGNAVPARLVIAGEGPERPELERLAGELQIADRALFTGQVKPEAVLGTFDIFALSSDTEQMPNALLEAMAASRPIAAVDVGDVKTIVCEENRNFIVPRDNLAAFGAVLQRLLRDDATRARLGRSNCARAIAEFSQERMFGLYADVFDASLPAASQVV